MPHTQLPALAQHFRQCQNCYRSDVPLKNCAGCNRSHYCSRECQKAHWRLHKDRCNHNRDVRTLVREHDLNNETAPLPGELSRRDADAILKTWVHVYKPALQIAVVNALTLQSTPARCQTHLVDLTLAPTPSISRHQQSIPGSFEVEHVSVRSFDDAIAASAAHEGLRHLLDRIEEESAPVRARGGLGFAVLLTRVPNLGPMLLTPFGMMERLDDLPVDPRWEVSLKRFIRRGVPI